MRNIHLNILFNNFIKCCLWHFLNVLNCCLKIHHWCKSKITLCNVYRSYFSGKIIDSLPHLKGAPGRLDLAGRLANGAAVYVDYAHTPDALENVLKTMRHHTAGKLWVVFGCGGDRDKLKRPIMGRIVRELADRAVVTDDNPRTEDAAEIRRQILCECPDAAEIGDRVEAINYAVSRLEKGDMLVIAGKGHENGQKIGDRIIPMNDLEEAAKAIARLSR